MNEKETTPNQNQELVPLRQSGAILVQIDLSTLSHTHVKNMYGDNRTMRQLYEVIRSEEIKDLKKNALRYKRFEFVREYFAKHGTYPSREDIERIALNQGSNDNDDE